MNLEHLKEGGSMKNPFAKKLKAQKGVPVILEKEPERKKPQKPA